MTDDARNTESRDGTLRRDHRVVQRAQFTATRLPPSTPSEASTKHGHGHGDGRCSP
jgi:hypothetical protein